MMEAVSEKRPEQHSSVRGLLVSVGGTPNPVAWSLDYHRPEKVIFFASKDSRTEIETKVRPLTSHRWSDQETVTTEDAQDLVRCLEALADSLPAKLATLELSASDLIVDYTGGTKTMSAALVLATIHEPVRYSYVGGQVRTKQGLGVVLDGSEALVFAPNPWDVLAVEYRRRIAGAFNQSRFAEARDTASEAASRVSERWRTFFVALRDLCEAYQRVHCFDYTSGEGLLKGAQARLRQFASAANDGPLLAFLDLVAGDQKRVSLLARSARSGQDGTSIDLAAMRAVVLDLVANARTVAVKDGRPDDGVARLYAALEKLAKTALLSHGVDTGNVPSEQIPDSLREEFVSRYSDSGVLRFGLLAAMRLLEELGDPLGRRFREGEAELMRVLEARNTSLMVHGWKAVDRKVFDRMLDITLGFLDVSAEMLPPTPVLPSR